MGRTLVLGSGGSSLTSLGVSAAAQTILDDASVAAILTTLGITAAAQTLLDDATVAAILKTLGGQRAIFVPTVGHWYPSLLGVTAAGGVITAVNSIRWHPFSIRRGIAIDGLMAHVDTLLAAKNFQLAVYADNPAHTDGHRPTGSELIATANMSTAAATVVTAAVAATNLPEADYWMGFNTDAGGTLKMKIMAGSNNPTSFLVGSATAANISPSTATQNMYLTSPSTFGTWGDVTGHTFTETIDTLWCVGHYKVASLL